MPEFITCSCGSLLKLDNKDHFCKRCCYVCARAMSIPGLNRCSYCYASWLYLLKLARLANPNFPNLNN